MTPRDHVFKGSSDFMGGSLSEQVTTLPCFISIDLVQMEIEDIQFVAWPHNPRD